MNNVNKANWETWFVSFENVLLTEIDVMKNTDSCRPNSD